MRYPKDRGNNPSAYATNLEYTIYLAGRANAARNNRKKLVFRTLFTTLGILSSLGILVFAVVMRILSGFDWGSTNLFFGEQKLFAYIGLGLAGLLLILAIIDLAVYRSSFNRISGINPRRDSAGYVAYIVIIFAVAFIFLCTEAQFQIFYLIPFYGGMVLTAVGVILELSISEYGYDKK